MARCLWSADARANSPWRCPFIPQVRWWKQGVWVTDLAVVLVLSFTLGRLFCHSESWFPPASQDIAPASGAARRLRETICTEHASCRLTQRTSTSFVPLLLLNDLTWIYMTQMPYGALLPLCHQCYKVLSSLPIPWSEKATVSPTNFALIPCSPCNNLMQNSPILLVDIKHRLLWSKFLDGVGVRDHGCLPGSSSISLYQNIRKVC